MMSNEYPSHHFSADGQHQWPQQRQGDAQAPDEYVAAELRRREGDALAELLARQQQMAMGGAAMGMGGSALNSLPLPFNTVGTQDMSNLMLQQSFLSNFGMGGMSGLGSNMAGLNSMMTAPQHTAASPMPISNVNNKDVPSDPQFEKVGPANGPFRESSPVMEGNGLTAQQLLNKSQAFDKSTLNIEPIAMGNRAKTSPAPTHPMESSLPSATGISSGLSQASAFAAASGQEDPGWDDQFHALRAYMMQHGNCRVPARYKANPKLGRWVMTQRRQFTLLMQGMPSALSAGRIRRLEGIGFTWSVRPEPVTTWNKKFQELKDYKKAHGNCMVPQRFQTNPQLGTWVHTQRRQYKLMSEGKKSSMTQQKVDALNSVGFDWDAKHVTSSSASKRNLEREVSSGSSQASQASSQGSGPAAEVQLKK